jgi:hypothetical protein
MASVVPVLGYKQPELRNSGEPPTIHLRNEAMRKIQPIRNSDRTASVGGGFILVGLPTQQLWLLVIGLIIIFTSVYWEFRNGELEDRL